LAGLAMEDVGTFCGHMVSFSAIRNILWTFGLFCGNLVCFPRFGIMYQEKSCNPTVQAFFVE
jgi:hypothetical protein